MAVFGVVGLVFLQALQLFLEVANLAEVAFRFGGLNLDEILLDVVVNGFHE